MLPIILAFLLNNDLTGFRIQFFVDGQRTLENSIIKFFSCYINIGIILDWYHLEKKCKEQLGMALKGRHIRNEVFEKVTHILWYGAIDAAIEYLRSIDKESIKNADAIERLIGYFERNRFQTMDACLRYRKPILPTCLAFCFVPAPFHLTFFAGKGRKIDEPAISHSKRDALKGSRQ